MYNALTCSLMSQSSIQILLAMSPHLTPEHAAECAVILRPYLLHNLIHGPAIQVLVRTNGQRDSVLLLIALDSLQGVVSVTLDALVNRQEKEVQPVPAREANLSWRERQLISSYKAFTFMLPKEFKPLCDALVAVVESGHDVCQHRRILAPAGPERHSLSPPKEICTLYRFMHFRFKRGEEAFLAHFCPIFGPPKRRTAIATQLAQLHAGWSNELLRICKEHICILSFRTR